MTLQIDHPTHLTIRLGPPARSGTGPVDVRSVRAAMAMMEDSGRRAFAQRTKRMPVVWPTVKATWDGLVLTISGAVSHG